MWVSRYWNTLQHEAAFVKNFGVLVLDLRLADEMEIQLNVLVGFDDADL